jgi:hypothetical protein
MPRALCPLVHVQNGPVKSSISSLRSLLKMEFVAVRFNLSFHQTAS